MNKLQEQKDIILKRLNIANAELFLFRNLSDFKYIDGNLENDGDGSSKYVYGVLKNRNGRVKNSRAKIGKIKFVGCSLFFGLSVYIPLLLQGII